MRGGQKLVVWSNTQGTGRRLGHTSTQASAHTIATRCSIIPSPIYLLFIIRGLTTDINAFYDTLGLLQFFGIQKYGCTSLQLSLKLQLSLIRDRANKMHKNMLEGKIHCMHSASLQTSDASYMSSCAVTLSEW